MKIMRECFNPAAGSDSLIGEYLIEGFRDGRDQGINGYLVHNVPEYADQYNYIVARYIPDKDELWFWGAWKDEKPALEAAKDIDGQVIYRNGYYNDHNIANDYPSEETDESLNEDTVKQGKKWVNKGEEGTHGTFNTKKEADAQRKAMFANGYKEGLEEAKKEEDELPPDPEAVKLEVHTNLNNLVASEISTIDEYDQAKADILDAPIEHKDELISTIDHIKEEEKEHIDELINATSEIPFAKTTSDTPVAEPTTEPDEVTEEDDDEWEDEVEESLAEDIDTDEDDESFPVMIAGFGGDGEHYIYYIGYDNDKARSTFDELKGDWVEFGLGGGDTELAALEYTGDIAKFEEAIKAFEADPENTIFDDFFTDDDVEVLDSVLDESLNEEEDKKDENSYSDKVRAVSNRTTNMHDCYMIKSTEKSPAGKEFKVFIKPLLKTTEGDIDGTNKIFIGAAKDFTDYICYFNSELKAKAFINRLNTRKIANAADLKVVPVKNIIRDISLSGAKSISVGTECGPVFINTFKLNKALQESLTEDKTVDYVDYKHSYCHELEPKMKQLNYMCNVLKVPTGEVIKKILGILKSATNINKTEKEQWFYDTIKNKKWNNSKEIYQFIKNSINKAKEVEATVDDKGELKKESLKEDTNLINAKVADVEYNDDDGYDCHVLIYLGNEDKTEEEIEDDLTEEGMMYVFVNDIFEKEIPAKNYGLYDVIESYDVPDGEGVSYTIGGEDDDEDDDEWEDEDELTEYLVKGLQEHINDRPDPIEDKSEFKGQDNAVVDCPVSKLIAHSEDEKPLDCEMKKEPLPKNLTTK